MIVIDTSARGGGPSTPAQQITHAIRTIAGNDAPLARHLRQFADEQIAAQVPVKQIVSAIYNGVEVA